MRNFGLHFFATLAAGSLVVGCGDKASGETGATEDGDGSGLMTNSEVGSGESGGESDTTGGDDGPRLDAMAGTTGDGDCTPAPGNAQISGTVFAPDGAIPVSGAIVYTTDSPPAGIPQEVYCAECVELDCSINWTYSAADGSFATPAQSGDRYLVIQKGQFMRITPITVDPGNNPLPSTITALPDYNDPANGLYIPKIALGLGSYDRLEDGLAKLGLGDIMLQGQYGQQLVPGTEQFDIWDNGGSVAGITTMGTMNDLFTNPAAMDQYHIIFAPCSTDSYAPTDPTIQQNIRDWVGKGGKWYVSDWSGEMIMFPFDEYQDFVGEGPIPSVGDPDQGSYNSTATVLDDDLTSWLAALPPALKDINPENGGGSSHPTVNNPPLIDLVDNWSGIQTIHPVIVQDEMGMDVDVSHKVWVEGPYANNASDIKPNAITAQFGCGKIMFTTYHTAEFNATYTGLSPQELVLMYLILEIGVCQEPVPVPPAD